MEREDNAAMSHPTVINEGGDGPKPIQHEDSEQLKLKIGEHIGR